MDWQFEGDPSFRARRQALLLTAACAWLMNGIHSTPDIGSSARDLMNAILPHVDRIGADINILAYGTPTDDDDEEEVFSDDSEEDGDIPNTRRRHDATTLPAYPYGLVFTRILRVSEQNPVPRFQEEGHTIGDKAFKYFFKVAPENIRNLITVTGHVGDLHPKRVPNKACHTAVFHPSPDQTLTDNHFNLARLGHALEAKPIDAGSDIEDSDDEDFDDGCLTELEQQRRQLHAIPPGQRTIDMELTQAWRQFLFDLTARSPNQKGAANPSYCKLSKKERATVSEATYKNYVLSDYFIDVRYKLASPKDWEAAFDNLWPKADSKLYGKAQNYRQCQYLKDWKNLVRRSEAKPGTIRAMRKVLRKKFDTLYWVPFAQRERMWSTKFDRRFIKISGKPEGNPAPMVLINGLDPSW